MSLAKLDCLFFDSSLCNFLTQLVSLRYALGISLLNISPVCLTVSAFIIVVLVSPFYSFDFKLGSPLCCPNSMHNHLTCCHGRGLIIKFLAFSEITDKYVRTKWRGGGRGRGVIMNNGTLYLIYTHPAVDKLVRKHFLE